MTEIAPTMTVPELAQRLGIDPSTAYRYLRAGALPGVQAGSGWIIDRQRVERLLAGHEDAQGRALIQDPPLAQQPTQGLMQTGDSAADLGTAWLRGALAALELLLTSIERHAATEDDQRQNISD
jgi:excisionase family DNA binding protein